MTGAHGLTMKTKHTKVNYPLEYELKKSLCHNRLVTLTMSHKLEEKRCLLDLVELRKFFFLSWQTVAKHCIKRPLERLKQFLTVHKQNAKVIFVLT